MFNDSVEQDNLEAFERLLTVQEHEEESDRRNYKFYRDLYGNEYIWYTHRQSDDKFHAEIFNSRSKKRRKRYFARKKSALKWLRGRYYKATKKQKVVIEQRVKRKQERDALKPKLTEREKTVIHAEKKIKNYENLISKADRKIKSLMTRKKNYTKKIKYHKKKIQEVKAK